ncbi:LOW QUALITY PROTEIN: ninein-like protein [Embiotoca jacksoni]|uniref:LOW QUALITY PROTEIN: ninein-like protein n=1 Tax=Embiotoca jacksoni TaxID=100190 RepID=UPI003704997F
MEEAEQSRYVAQLKAEFDSCDTTASGFLDRDELTELCRKLQLDAQLDTLLDTLLGGGAHTQVDFDKFKEGFVDVLSRSLDFSTSEDDSSYLEPVVPEEVKPKFVKGAKHYGRRSRPDSQPDALEDSRPSRTEASDSPAAGRRAKLRRATSLESVESLKSDDETGSQKDLQTPFQSKGHQLEGAELGEEEGGGRVLTAACDHLTLQHLHTEDVDELLRKLHADLDGRISIIEFRRVLCGSAPILCSPPFNQQTCRGRRTRSFCCSCQSSGQSGCMVSDRCCRWSWSDRWRRGGGDVEVMYCTSGLMSGCGLLTWVRTDRRRTSCYTQFPAVPEEMSVRSTSPSLLTATMGHRVLSRLDDGSGCTSPERVVSVWTEEGIRNSRDILQTLDFPLEERLSLVDLTLALDNELLVSGNGIHQAALISYKTEIQHLQEEVEEACRQRDKMRADLEQADQRNLQLIREVDDRHVTMETLNQTRIRDLEQDFRDRLAALRSQSEQESEALLQQEEREHSALQEQLQLLRAQEAGLQEELCSTRQENSRLEEEFNAARLQLTEAQSSVNRLQSDLDHLLHDKFGSLDPAGAGLCQEERFTEIVKDYELQCRELRDRNDELSSEVELLKTQRSNRKWRRPAGGGGGIDSSWRQHNYTLHTSDDSDMKRSSPRVRKKLQLDDKAALGSLDVSSSTSGPAVSIQTELALEQLKQNHNQELQQLNVQLETQVNYYERSLDLMRNNMEVERKDICQAFKLEISELEEQKSEAEQQLKEALDKLHTQIQSGGGGRSHEQERRMQREHAELEQNFAREIGNLVQKLSAEKDQLEAELKLKMDQEVMLVREESEEQLRQMKLQHGETQRRLLHHLHRERQQLQEQRGFWEKLQSEEQAGEEQAGEEQARICTQFSSDRKRAEEQHEEEVRHLKEQLAGLQEATQTSSQSEAGLEAELAACRGRCSGLEARLEESIAFLESHEGLNRRLEEELQLLRSREEELQAQVAQLRAELGDLQEVADNLSQQEALLRAEDHTVASLRAELDDLQEVLRSRAEAVCRLTAELESLKTDRARLIQDLKDQAMAVDHLQLQLDGVFEELDRRRSSEEALQGDLEQERSRTSQLRYSLAEEKEEAVCLGQENRTYARLADQLSTQIVEMEEEISSLRDLLRDLSSQLNGTADLVLDLRRQLNSRTSQVDRLQAESADQQTLQDSQDQLDLVRQQVVQLQGALQDSQNQLRRTEVDFEGQKTKTRQQLMELERLVLDLEEVMDPASPHRAQLEEVRSENTVLQERLNLLQQELHGLEDEVAKRRRKQEEMEREHQRSREEEERLHKENSKYREEVLDLSSRNLQLSNDNAELSARLRGDQESVRMLRERLAMVSREQDEDGAEVKRLQDAAMQQERENRMQQTAWRQEREEMERDLRGCRDKVEKLQKCVMSLESEAELLRSQLQSVNQEKLGHTQEVTELQKNLQDAHSKVEELEAGLSTQIKEKEELRQVLEEQEETHKLRVQNQELQHQLTEQQNLKIRMDEVEASRTQAQDQAVRADAALSQVQAQHLRQLQEVQQREGGRREQVEVLQARLEEEQWRSQQLEEEQRRSRQLEEALRLQAQQNSSQISMKQDQYEKAMCSLQRRMEEQETQLKAVRLLLQENVQQLRDQLSKNSRSSALLKDVYGENSALMAALQVTEQRQKHAEKKNVLLEDKIRALNQLLRDIVPAALAT